MRPKGGNKGFWDRYAMLYDFEIKCFNGNAYADMYRMMGSSLSANMNVLEVATVTGLIAPGISEYVRSIRF